MKNVCLRLVIAASACLWAIPTQASSWWQPPPESFENLQALEYFLRWDYTDFNQRYSWQQHALQWFWGAPAHAELPPEYQKAFSLRVLPDHRQQQLQVNYHEQMVIDDKSHRWGSFTADKQSYQELKSLLTQQISCTQGAEQGWAGPAPQMLRLSYRNGSQPQHLMYADTSPRGPAGPSEEEYKKSVRRYLCQETLKKWLQQQILKAQKK